MTAHILLCQSAIYSKNPSPGTRVLISQNVIYNGCDSFSNCTSIMLTAIFSLWNIVQYIDVTLLISRSLSYFISDKCINAPEKKSIKTSYPVREQKISLLLVRIYLRWSKKLIAVIRPYYNIVSVYLTLTRWVMWHLFSCVDQLVGLWCVLFIRYMPRAMECLSNDRIIWFFG